MRIVRGFYGVAAMPSCGLTTAAPLSRPCLFTLFPLGHNAKFVRIALEIACIAFALVTLPSLRNSRILSTHLICSTIAMESTATPVSFAGKTTRPPSSLTRRFQKDNGVNYIQSLSFSFIGGYRTAFVAAIFFRIVRENDALSLGAFPAAFPSEPAISIGIVLVNLPFVPGEVLANHVGKIPDLLALSILFSAPSDTFSDIPCRGAFHNRTYPG
jgi:hypothetical protein